MAWYLVKHKDYFTFTYTEKYLLILQSLIQLLQEELQDTENTVYTFTMIELQKLLWFVREFMPSTVTMTELMTYKNISPNNKPTKMKDSDL